MSPNFHVMVTLHGVSCLVGSWQSLLGWQLEVIWEDMLTNSAMSPYISSTAACVDATVPIGYGLTGEGTTQTLGEAVEGSSPWLGTGGSQRKQSNGS